MIISPTLKSKTHYLSEHNLSIYGELIYDDGRKKAKLVFFVRLKKTLNSATSPTENSKKERKREMGLKRLRKRYPSLFTSLSTVCFFFFLFFFDNFIERNIYIFQKKTRKIYLHRLVGILSVVKLWKVCYLSIYLFSTDDIELVKKYPGIIEISTQTSLIWPSLFKSFDAAKQLCSSSSCRKPTCFLFLLFKKNLYIKTKIL